MAEPVAAGRDFAAQMGAQATATSARELVEAGLERRSMLENARAKARKLLAEAPNKCLLTAQQQAEGRSIVAEADALVGATKRM